MEQQSPPIYLDYNATTPIDHEVIDHMIPYMKDHWGNPSSSHFYGSQPKIGILQARQNISDLIDCSPDEIIFTSGGTEANNYAIKGYIHYISQKRKIGLSGNSEDYLHIITSSIEHLAVLDVCHHLEKNPSIKITYLPVDHKARVSPELVKAAIRPQTVLISIMHSNNEVGTIQDIKEISKIAHTYHQNEKKKEIDLNDDKFICVHTDASQSIGKVPISVETLGVDLLTIAGHKLYAPKGIGALFIRRGIELEKQIHGAPQEFKKRPGTENVVLDVALGKACEIAKRDLLKNAKNMKERRDQLLTLLQKKLSEFSIRYKVNSDCEEDYEVKISTETDEDGENSISKLKCLPNTLNISFAGVQANLLLSDIQNHVAASAGAACHSDIVEMSSVLTAMKISKEYGMGTIRLSTGKHTSSEEIESSVEVIIRSLQKLAPKVESSNNKTIISNDIEGNGELQGLIDNNGNPIKLTKFTRGLGCGCKMSPLILEKLLSNTKTNLQDDNILVGNDTSDDAAVYQITPSLSVVSTVDFFTPIVDDPYYFGAISAANSISDVYAMGGTPRFALAVVGFPANRLAPEVLQRIQQGAQDKCAEAGVSIIGGHTIDDTEPKYGLCVTGIIESNKIIRNVGMKPNDVLILTKPLGIGVLTTAMKNGLVENDVKDEAIKVMSTLNNKAAELFKHFEVHAATDVTGFGLLGHLKEMLGNDNNIEVEVFSKSIKYVKGAEKFILTDSIPGGTMNNYNFLMNSGKVTFDKKVPQHIAYLLADAQTSGGLIISTKRENLDKILEMCSQNHMEWIQVIGYVKEKEGNGLISVKYETFPLS